MTVGMTAACKRDQVRRLTQHEFDLILNPKVVRM